MAALRETRRAGCPALEVGHFRIGVGIDLPFFVGNFLGNFVGMEAVPEV